MLAERLPACPMYRLLWWISVGFLVNFWRVIHNACLRTTQKKQNRLSSARSGQIEIVSKQVYVDVIPFPDFFV